MAGVRHLRVIGLTALVVILIVVLHQTGRNAASLVFAQASDEIANKHRAKSNNGAVQAAAGSGKGGEGGAGGKSGGNGGVNPVVVSNNIVDSNNDEKTDDAINQEISKDKSEEGVKKKPSGEEGQNRNKENGAVAGGGVAKSGKNVNGNGNGVSGSGSGAGSGAGSGSADVTTNEKGEYDPQAELIKIRALSPMTIFSKSYCPYSKKLKSLLLDKYEITPTPNVVELDLHEHGDELQTYLYEKSGRRTVPNVLVGSSFESRGGSDDFAEYHQKNQVIKLLTDWGQGRLQVSKKDTPSNA
ncbi:hypothetical protein KGF57_001642 [Candida theae]|uniref:Glutaredoxin domain-containing protein n=1 Tax=Candida theae TaxID=1198502 RepID=A0AAD5BGV4_9ASCO|nr:uncharacterized protein KGF57_001642 [Candida theae]KAI5961708.1 hypothetical protein KGF57_001642 [Candida theae]